jgi:hypothetical protein
MEKSTCPLEKIGRSRVVSRTEESFSDLRYRQRKAVVLH